MAAVGYRLPVLEHDRSTSMTDTPQESPRLAGRRVLITGAASGIGRATAGLFAAHGARLALLDRDADGLRAVGGLTGGVVAEVDLLDEPAIEGAVGEVARTLGGLDGVVNVAGIGGGGQRLAEIDADTWSRVLAVNLTAPMLVCRQALPYLEEIDSVATIVNVASGQGLVPSAAGMGSYCASKGGLVMFSKAIALELAPKVRVNVVCPGVVDTPLLPESMRDAARRPGSPYAMKRVGEAEEVARAILFLTSADSSFVTGTAMAVDGGRTYH
jgi:NAD(P)-dependent dehydrogenase (short-subunit alcohol dehydrogenase family)